MQKKTLCLNALYHYEQFYKIYAFEMTMYGYVIWKVQKKNLKLLSFPKPE